MNNFFKSLLGALVQVGIGELQRKAAKQGSANSKASGNLTNLPLEGRVELCPVDTRGKAVNEVGKLRLIFVRPYNQG